MGKGRAAVWMAVEAAILKAVLNLDNVLMAIWILNRLMAVLTTVWNGDSG